jgi:hypothetical protein
MEGDFEIGGQGKGNKEHQEEFGEPKYLPLGVPLRRWLVYALVRLQQQKAGHALPGVSTY